MTTRTRILRGAIAGCVVGALAVIAGRLAPLQRLELVTADARMQAASPADSPPVAIIGITQEDIRPDRLGPMPWPRRRYAEAVAKLHRLGARVIVFDLYFPQPSDDPAADEALVQAVRRAGNVLLPVYAKVDPRERHGRLVQGVWMLDLSPSQYLERNMPALAQAAAGQGHINLSANDPDHIFRRIPAAVGFQETGEVFHALSVRAAAMALGGQNACIRLDDGHLEIEDRRWPLSTIVPGTVPVDYSGVAAKLDVQAFPWRAPFGLQKSIFLYSFGEFLREDFPAAAVAGRVVLVGGLIYERHPDVHPTPAGQQPGVVIHALAIQTLLGQRNPHWLPAAQQAALTVLLSVLVGVASFPWRFRWSITVFVAGLGMLGASSVWAFEAGGLFIETVAPGAAMGVMFVLASTHTLAVSGHALKKRERELDTLVEMGRISASLVSVPVGRQSRLLRTEDVDVLAPPLGWGVTSAAETVATTIRNVLGAQVAACYVVDADTNELALVATSGVPLDEVPDEIASAGSTAGRQATSERRPILWHHGQNGAAPSSQRVTDLLCVPISL